MCQSTIDRYAVFYSLKSNQFTPFLKVTYPLHAPFNAVQTPEGILYLSTTFKESYQVRAVYYINISRKTWSTFDQAAGGSSSSQNGYYSCAYGAFVDNKYYVLKCPLFPIGINTSFDINSLYHPFSYEIVQLDTSKDLWIHGKMPLEIQSDVNSIAAFVATKNAFLFLYQNDRKIQGFLWKPGYAEMEPIMSHKYYEQKMDWTGTHLIGLAGYRNEALHGFMYNPENNQWDKIHGSGGPSNLDYFKVVTFQNYAIAFDRNNGKGHIYG